MKLHNLIILIMIFNINLFAYEKDSLGNICDEHGTYPVHMEKKCKNRCYEKEDEYFHNGSWESCRSIIENREYKKRIAIENAERESAKALKRAQETAKLHENDYNNKYKGTKKIGGLEVMVFENKFGQSFSYDYMLSENTNKDKNFILVHNDAEFSIYHKGEEIAKLRLYNGYAMKGVCLVNNANINHISACINAYNRLN